MAFSDVKSALGQISTASGITRVARLLTNVPASFTVANLPSPPTLGQTATVSDGTASLAWGATVTGGGSTKYLVWYNGTHWTVMGK